MGASVTSGASATLIPETTPYWSVSAITRASSGPGEKPADILKASSELEDVKRRLEEQELQCEISQLARGLTPGEDLVQFAEEKQIDHIFLGIEKRSRVGKLLLGSTAQYIILNAPCPVTTVKPD